MAQRVCEMACSFLKLCKPQVISVVQQKQACGRVLSRGFAAKAGVGTGTCRQANPRANSCLPHLFAGGVVNSTTSSLWLLKSGDCFQRLGIGARHRATFATSATSASFGLSTQKAASKSRWGLITAGLLCPSAAAVYYFRDELQKELGPIMDRFRAATGLPSPLSAKGSIWQADPEPVEISAAPGPSLLGFVIFSFTLSMWVYAQLLPPLAIYMWYKHGSYVFLVSLISYYIYRGLVTPDRIPIFQSVISNFLQRNPYFPEQLVVLDAPDMMPEPRSRAMLSFHPHGVLTCGALLNGMLHPTVLKAEPIGMVGSGLFGISFLRDLLCWFGFKPWTRDSILGEMAKGENLLLMPGGFEEASCYKRDTHRTYIKDRKGWIKHALMHGYQIYPVYTFGEEKTYWSWQGLMKYRLLANKYQFPGVVFIGKWYTWLPANNSPLITVIGAPLELPLIESPSREDVSKYHAMYVRRLQELFDKYKGKYAEDPYAELQVVGPGDFGFNEK